MGLGIAFAVSAISAAFQLAVRVWIAMIRSHQSKRPDFLLNPVNSIIDLHNYASNAWRFVEFRFLQKQAKPFQRLYLLERVAAVKADGG